MNGEGSKRLNGCPTLIWSSQNYGGPNLHVVTFLVPLFPHVPNLLWLFIESDRLSNETQLRRQDYI